MSINNSDLKTRQLVITALMVTLVLVGTIMIRVPIPLTQGYVHLGDAMIYLGVLLLGRKNGTIAAGLGSAMGDILGGFAFWAPWTLAIKMLMAYVTGLLIDRAGHHHEHGADHTDHTDHPESSAALSKITLADITAMTAGGIIMSLGYLVAERVMYGSWAVAALGLPWNAGQFIVGIMIASILYPLLSRVAGK